MKAFRKVSSAFDTFQSPHDVGLTSPILNDIIYSLPMIKDTINEISSSINLSEAEDDNRSELWNDPDKYPAVDDMKMVRKSDL